MECPICFTEIDPNTKVCPSCGETVEIGNELEKTKKELFKIKNAKKIILWIIIIALIIGVFVLLCVTGAIWWIIGIAVIIFAIICWLG